MVIILGILQFIIISSIVYLEFKNKSSSLFLWVVLWIMFAMMHLLESLTLLSGYSSHVISIASINVIGFSLFYLIVRMFLLPYASKRKKSTISSNKEAKIIKVSIFLTVISIIVPAIMMIQFIGGVKNISWGVMRDFTESLGYFNSIQVYMVLFFLFSSVLLFLLKDKRIKTALIVVVLTIFKLALGANRIEILPLLISFISLYLIKIDNIKIKHIFSFLILSFIVLYFVYGLRAYRHYGTIENFFMNFNFKDFNDKIFGFFLTGDGELGLRRDFYYFIDNNNNFQNFNKGHTYIRMLFVFIPTNFSFGLKPPDFAISMGQAIGMAVGGSTHPTLFGDAYANFGNFGMLAGIIWALIVSFNDRIINKQPRIFKDMLYVFIASMYVIIARGSVYNGFVWLSYGLLVFYFTRVLVLKLTIKKKGVSMLDIDK